MKSFSKILYLIVLLFVSHFTVAGAYNCMCCKEPYRIATNIIITPKQTFDLVLLNLKNNIAQYQTEKSVLNTQDAITVEEADFNTFAAIRGLNLLQLTKHLV